MYAKCGSMVEARRVFDCMSLHDVVSWNALVLGYATHGQGEIALDIFFKRMSCPPDSRTFVAAFTACSGLAERAGANKDVQMYWLERGRDIRSRAAAAGCEFDPFVSSACINMFSKCASMVEARSVFDRMDFPGVVCWNSIIMGYVENGDSESALEIFSRMSLREGSGSDARTARSYVSGLTACARLGSKEKEETGKLVWLAKGRKIHLEAANNGFETNLFVATALVEMYSKCGSLPEARVVFERLPNRDIACWNTLLSGYVENNESESAVEIFTRMRPRTGYGCSPNARTYVGALTACGSLGSKERDMSRKLQWLNKGREIHVQASEDGLVSNIFVGNTLVDMYSKCGSMSQAERVFFGMPVRDVISWNALMTGFVDNGESHKALELYFRMDETANQRTYVVALMACAGLLDLAPGRRVHAEIHRRGFDSGTYVATCAIDLYCKCGSLETAQHMFDSAEPSKDNVLWNALIAGYSRRGHLQRVTEIFQAMEDEGVRPDGVTFLSVLTACSHAGVVERGRKVFEAMESPEYKVGRGIEHYHCMVDMLGRANRLEDALEMVRSMPFGADSVSWTTLLAACHKWKNVCVGKISFEALQELGGGQEASTYSLMANIYGS